MPQPLPRKPPPRVRVLSGLSGAGQALLVALVLAFIIGAIAFLMWLAG